MGMLLQLSPVADRTAAHTISSFVLAEHDCQFMFTRILFPYDWY